MNKKTNRKNKTNLTVKWPVGYFTIDQLNKENSEFINITLRVRLKSALEDKQVVEIGTLHAGHGRPKLAFACAPVSASTIQAARDAGINVHSSFNNINVATATTPVTEEASVTTQTVVTETAAIKA